MWKQNVTLPELAKMRNKNMTEHLGIEFTEIGANFLKGTMPVDERTLQPDGILHGGASCALAETLGSIAGHLCIDKKTQRVAGIDIHTSHIRSISKGIVTGCARPIHIGRSTHIWEIRIEDEEGKLISLTRLLLAVLNR